MWDDPRREYQEQTKIVIANTYTVVITSCSALSGGPFYILIYSFYF